MPNVTIFRDRALRKVIKVRMRLWGGSLNPLGLVAL